MPGKKLNARDLIVEVSDGQATPTWIQVDGLNSAMINKGENEEVADTTTFASDGEYEQEIMQRGSVLELEGFLYDDAGDPDPGQGRCSEMATLKGAESLGDIRMRYPSWLNWVEWTATFTEGESGGGNNDKASWAMTVTRSGPARSTAVTP